MVKTSFVNAERFRGLVDATDSEAVAGLPGCSCRTGERLTEVAREAASAARDAAIIADRGWKDGSADTAETGASIGAELVRRAVARCVRSREAGRGSGPLRGGRRPDTKARPPRRLKSAKIYDVNPVNRLLSRLSRPAWASVWKMPGQMNRNSESVPRQADARNSDER
jgi:hypothetical protein